jgi:hypothetical protein
LASETTIYTHPLNSMDGWHHEGGGEIFFDKPGVMRLECIGSQQGGAGCMAFCREEFPDHIAVEYGVRMLNTNGLFITFVGLRGLNGEDAIGELPPRTGVFKDYVGDDAAARSYHVSISRYDDQGRHTGVSNWRRNPGLHLMAQGEDLCKEAGPRYDVRIEKDGPRCALFVNGERGPSFVDPGELPDAIPEGGKVGFRAIGSNVVVEIDSFTVKSLV